MVEKKKKKPRMAESAEGLVFGVRLRQTRKDRVMCSLQIPASDLGLHPKSKNKSWKDLSRGRRLWLQCGATEAGLPIWSVMQWSEKPQRTKLGRVRSVGMEGNNWALRDRIREIC